MYRLALLKDAVKHQACLGAISRGDDVGLHRVICGVAAEAAGDATFEEGADSAVTVVSAC